MRLLFAITVCSFCAGLLVALALVRRIRRGEVLMARQTHPHVDPTHEFFEAGEYRTPRPLHLDQEIFQQKPRRPLSEFTFTSATPAATAKVSTTNGTAIVNSATAVFPPASSTVRTPPHSIRSAIPRRIDLTRDSHEADYIAGPYATFLRRSGTKGPASSSLPNRRLSQI